MELFSVQQKKSMMVLLFGELSILRQLRIPHSYWYLSCIFKAFFTFFMQILEGKSEEFSGVKLHNVKCVKMCDVLPKDVIIY